MATSRELTPRKRRNLEARARQLGFTLRNIHDRDDFTGRLYRNSKWRLELLGLPGTPPALSAIPRLVGPRRTGELIGRDNELDRLRRHRGDVVVVGQPGVGKTALFETLAREDRGLFVVSDDPGRIADAFRDNPVSLLFVDDAHFNEPLIDLLARLREEPGFDFKICASTWPNRAEAVEGQLYLRREERMAVNGLARDQVAQLIRREEPRLPEDVIGEILNQSDDPPDEVLQVTGSCRPGLAMTLARHTDLRGIEPLVQGGLLLEGLRRDARLSGTELDYVATLGLGGEAGMRKDVAARALNQPEVKLRQALKKLSGTRHPHGNVAGGPRCETGGATTRLDGANLLLGRAAPASGGGTARRGGCRCVHRSPARCARAWRRHTAPAHPGSARGTQEGACRQPTARPVRGDGGRGGTVGVGELPRPGVVDRHRCTDVRARVGPRQAHLSGRSGPSADPATAAGRRSSAAGSVRLSKRVRGTSLGRSAPGCGRDGRVPTQRTVAADSSARWRSTGSWLRVANQPPNSFARVSRSASSACGEIP